MAKETASSKVATRYLNAITPDKIHLVKSSPEKIDTIEKIEARKSFGVNDLYYKLISLGQIHDLNFRNPHYHGDRQTCVEALQFAQKAPQYLSPHDFYLNAQKIEKMTKEIQAEKDSQKRQKLLEQKLLDLQNQNQNQNQNQGDLKNDKETQSINN